MYSIWINNQTATQEQVLEVLKQPVHINKPIDDQQWFPRLDCSKSECVCVIESGQWSLSP